MLKILPHHVYLIAEGLVGNLSRHYDSFHEEMWNGVVSRLRSEPEAEVRIVSGLDDICGACPYNRDAPNHNPELSRNYCRDGELERRNERRYARFFRIRRFLDGRPIRAKDLLRMIERRYPKDEWV